VILSRGGVLQPAAFQGVLEAAGRLPEGPAWRAPPGRPGSPEMAEEPFDLQEIERRAIRRALLATNNNRTRAARLLGISERTLRNKLNGRKGAPRTPSLTE